MNIERRRRWIEDIGVAIEAHRPSDIGNTYRWEYEYRKRLISLLRRLRRCPECRGDGSVLVAYDYEPHEAIDFGTNGGLSKTELETIAEAVREWMQEHKQLKELQAEPMERLRSKHEQSQAARIKELEAEVERLKAMTYLPSNEAIEGAGEMKTLEQSLEELRTHRDKAAKYDALRKRFPFWPGDEFYAFGDGKIRREVVECVSANGPMLLDGIYSKSWNWDECHPTADACRAAIPVE